MTFTGKSDTGHWVIMDTNEEIGGHGAGTRPLELVLVAMGGCTGMDVVSILKKMQQKYESLEIHLGAEISKDHPKVFKTMDVKFLFHAEEMDPEKVEKAIKLSFDRYCPVNAMLKHTVDISYSFEILPPEEA